MWGFSSLLPHKNTMLSTAFNLYNLEKLFYIVII
jgi:hypothetical protein